MTKNFLARQNQGTRIAVSRPESGINVCRKWDDFRRKGKTASGRAGERARRRGAILRVGRFGSLRWRVGANTLIPDGLNDGSQGIPRTRMRVKIRRKPWSVPRLRGRGEQGLRLGTRRV
jgi:hypothetical protein